MARFHHAQLEPESDQTDINNSAGYCFASKTVVGTSAKSSDQMDINNSIPLLQWIIFETFSLES